MSENSRFAISLKDSSVRVSSVVLNLECCRSGQYNLPDAMLRLHVNTKQNQAYVVFITLVNMRYEVRD